ncbi:hypothetical protein J4461_02940 [Candidatus Pacearchaeota archaeon]|nr:hypothetical protein [Candidatus Pacearchaeota archaeon]
MVEDLNKHLKVRKEEYLNKITTLLDVVYSSTVSQITQFETLVDNMVECARVGKLEGILKDYALPLFPPLTTEKDSKLLISPQSGIERKKITAEEYKRLIKNHSFHEIKSMYPGQTNALRGYARWYNPKSIR